MDTKSFSPKWGPVSPEEAALLDAEGGLTPGEVSTIDSEATLDSELTLAEELAVREESRLRAACTYQFEEELRRFRLAAGGTPKPNRWVNTDRTGARDGRGGR